jgi:hypothetical protein
MGRRLFTSGKSSSTTTRTTQSKWKTMWNKFTGPKPLPERYTTAWYGEMILICTVFGITGTSTMLLVRYIDITLTWTVHGQ